MVDLGKELSKSLAIGDVVQISGELGAGKTTLVRGMLRGLGHVGEVRSPTFNLIHEYATNPPVAHVDLFRLDSAEEVKKLGLTDYLDDFALLIEWPERLSEDLAPTMRIIIEFEAVGRRIQLFSMK